MARLSIGSQYSQRSKNLLLGKAEKSPAPVSNESLDENEEQDEKEEQDETEEQDDKGEQNEKEERTEQAEHETETASMAPYMQQNRALAIRNSELAMTLNVLEKQMQELREENNRLRDIPGAQVSDMLDQGLADLEAVASESVARIMDVVHGIRAKLGHLCPPPSKPHTPSELDGLPTSTPNNTKLTIELGAEPSAEAPTSTLECAGADQAMLESADNTQEDNVNKPLLEKLDLEDDVLEVSPLAESRPPLPRAGAIQMKRENSGDNATALKKRKPLSAVSANESNVRRPKSMASKVALNFKTTGSIFDFVDTPELVRQTRRSLRSRR